MSRIKGSKRLERYHQILALVYIAPLTQKEIAETLKNWVGIGSRSYISELLRDMERKGLITRRNFGNRKIVYITEKGIAFMHKRDFVNADQVRIIIERILNNQKLEYHKPTYSQGIEFDFFVDSKKLFIKIIDGIINHLTNDTLKALLNTTPKEELMENPIFRMASLKLVQALEDLTNEKGILLSLIHYAIRNPNKRILLIIIGDHPKEWPETMVKLLNKWGRLLHRPLVVGAREVLLEALSKLPRNIKIIFTKSTTADKIAESIKSIIISSDNA